MFAFSLGVWKPLLRFCAPVSFELQPLLDVAVTKEFTDNICSVHLKHTSTTYKINYILGDREIQGEQNEQSFCSIHKFAMVSCDWNSWGTGRFCS